MIWTKPGDPDSAYQANIAIELANRLFSAGYPTYLIGGVVRDAILGIPTLDVDICTACPGEEISRLIPNARPWGPHRYSVFKVETELGDIEIAHFREELEWDGRHSAVRLTNSLAEDIKRRDFTINALAVDPRNLELIDIIGGMADLSSRKIKTIGDPDTRFEEDRLRLLRAIRFGAKLNFSIDSATASSLKHQAIGIKSLSVERIRGEISSMLDSAHPGRALLLMADYTLWELVFPERADDPISSFWDLKMSTIERAWLANLPIEAMWALAILPALDPHKEDLLSAANIIRRLNFPNRLSNDILSLCKNIYYANNFDTLTNEKAIELADSLYIELTRELVFIRNPGSTFETSLAHRFPALDHKPFLVGDDLRDSLDGFSGNVVRDIIIDLRLAELTGQIRSKREARHFIDQRKKRHPKTDPSN